MVNWKEVAKFFSGFAAFETLGHLMLALYGMIPMPWFGFTLTPTINTLSIIFSAIISLVLAHYAWKK